MNAKLFTLACMVAASASSHAQVIRVVPEAFPIQAAPAAALPIRPMERAPAPAVDRALRIKAGDLISPRIVEWAGRNGYVLSWHAGEFRSGADLVLTDDFEKSLDAFLGSMRFNKVRLEAEIFANNAVRILEVK
ncbi:MAG: hypothetical protein DCF26_01370 [Burkholderiales bacterium]|jgi:hypothetical protein|nr:MAG: hypothetical protein DCF26_01370 [Burkholderiales bacterium]